MDLVLNIIVYLLLHFWFGMYLDMVFGDIDELKWI